MTTNDLLTTYTELFVTCDTDDNEVPPHFECSNCDRDVTDEPCPDHAPLGDLPGLRLMNCQAEPRHYVWVHQREDFGAYCPGCLIAQYAEREAEARRCRHWPWRRWAITRRLISTARTLGIISGYGINLSGDHHDSCVVFTGCRGTRTYILGVSRDTWRCWFRRHRRGDHVGFGLCGKCVPWPCCASVREDHTDGCSEAVTR